MMRRSANNDRLRAFSARFHANGAFSHVIWAIGGAVPTEKECRAAVHSPHEREEYALLGF